MHEQLIDRLQDKTSKMQDLLNEYRYCLAAESATFEIIEYSKGNFGLYEIKTGINKVSGTLGRLKSWLRLRNIQRSDIVSKLDITQFFNPIQ